MIAVDNPQILEEGYVIWDTTFDPWMMDIFDEQNEFKDYNYILDINGKRR